MADGVMVTRIKILRVMTFPSAGVPRTSRLDPQGSSVSAVTQPPIDRPTHRLWKLLGGGSKSEVFSGGTRAKLRRASVDCKAGMAQFRPLSMSQPGESAA